MTIGWTLGILLCAALADGTSCPSGCLCEDTLVICKCPIDKSVLGSFSKLEFVSRIYVHNCPKLTIPADAFAGVAVSQELSFVNVRSLTVEPNAFRDLIRYPDKLLIADTTMDELPTDAFPAISRAKHIWLKNVTMGRIASGAFKHANEIDYVYLRESSVERIEPGAFGDMIAVQHLFIRGRTQIGRLERSVFRGSILGKIVLEDVRIHRLNAFAFAEIRSFHQLLLDKVTVDAADVGDPPPPPTVGSRPVVSGGKLHIRHCVLSSLPVAAVCSNVNDVQVEKTTIDRLTAAGWQTRLRNVSRFRFSFTSIQSVESGSFSKAMELGQLIFAHCRLVSVDESAFSYLSDVRQISLISSELNTVHSLAFEQAEIDRLIVDNCRVDQIKSQAFRNAKIAGFSVVDSRLSATHPGAFGGLKVDSMSLIANRLDGVRRSAFSGLIAGLLNITNNTFINDKILDEAWLSGVGFRRIVVRQNKFFCSCQSSAIVQLAELQQLSLIAPDVFDVADNLCFNLPEGNQTMIVFRNACDDGRLSNWSKRPGKLWHSTLNDTFQCSSTSFVATCRCTEGNWSVWLQKRDVDRLPPIGEASVLIISDCNRLRLGKDSLSRTKLSHLIVRRSHRLSLAADFSQQNKAAQTLRSIRFVDIDRLVLHRNSLSIAQAAEDGKPVDISFENCTLDSLSDSSFEHARVGRLIFRRCRLGGFESTFAARAEFETLLIDDCDVGGFGKNAFANAVVRNLHLERSRIYSAASQFWPKTLSKTSFVCYRGNRLACRCPIDGLDILAETNGCDSDTNFCLDTASSTSASRLLTSTGTSGDELDRDANVCPVVKQNLVDKQTAEDQKRGSTRLTPKPDSGCFAYSRRTTVTGELLLVLATTVALLTGQLRR